MKKLFTILISCCCIYNGTSQNIRTVVAVKAGSFQKATVTLVNDSSFSTWVSTNSSAYDGYVNHVYYTNELPADSNQMMNVRQLPVLNHTNLKQISYPDGNSFFFQKLSGCISNCFFLRRGLLQNEKVLLTSAVTDDLEMLRYAARIKVPYTVYIQFKSGDDAGKIQQVNYIPKMFANKSKNKLAKMFRDYPDLKVKIQDEIYANNIDGLIELLNAFGAR